MNIEFGRKSSPAATEDLSKNDNVFHNKAGLSMPGITGYVNSTKVGRAR